MRNARLGKSAIKTGSTTSIRNGANVIPLTTTMANGFCTCEPMPLEIAAGKRPTPAITHVIKTGRILSVHVCNIACIWSIPPRTRRLYCERTTMPFMTDMPKSAMNPIAADTLNGTPVM